MARNKYPEETINLILDISLKLFLSKGYDNTSIQDIIDGLGGLSKGAIYHHFKSKESILLAAYKRMSDIVEEQMVKIRDNQSLNGLEKLREMFMSSLKNLKQRDLIAVTPNLLENPKFLAIQMNMMIEEIVPRYIEPVIRQGLTDGSIHTDYPRELADVLILMSNIWLNPLIYPFTEENVADKIGFFNELTKSLGLSLLDKGMEQYLIDIQRKRKKQAKEIS